MILTTKEQAKNLAVYSVTTDPLIDDMTPALWPKELKMVIELVFGKHTFTSAEIDEIICHALQVCR